MFVEVRNTLAALARNEAAEGFAVSAFLSSLLIFITTTLNSRSQNVSRTDYRLLLMDSGTSLFHITGTSENHVFMSCIVGTLIELKG